MHNDRYIKDYGLPLKRFLYYLRGILVCKWLSDKGTIPPVRFSELVEATVEDTDMKAKITHLLELKKRSNEHNLEPVDEQLFAWAQEWAEFYDQKVEQLHPEKKTSLDDKLNKLMYDTVNRMATEIRLHSVSGHTSWCKYTKKDWIVMLKVRQNLQFYHILAQL